MRKSFQLRASLGPVNAVEHTVADVADGVRSLDQKKPASSENQANSQFSDCASYWDEANVLKAAGNSWADAYVILDASDRVLISNQRFSDYFGIPANHIQSASLERLRACLEPCMESKEGFAASWNAVGEYHAARKVVEWEITKPSHRILELTVSPLPHAEDDGRSARVIIWQDITQKKQRHAALQQAHRMEVVGTLAAGIAHDFNNILTAINGNITLALDQLTAGEIKEASALLGVVMEAAVGGRELVKKLLSHVRQNATATRNMDLRAVVSDVQGLLKHTISPLIMVELRMPGNLWPVAGDANSIKQVLMNLCVNAVDAMKGRPNSHLIISAANQSGESAETSPCGDFVCLKVTDNGPGMTESVRARIFEPFFTTKSQADGTGLGLAISSDIVQKHGGRIECKSEPGKGTTFLVILPRTSGEIQCEPAISLPVQAPAASSKGTESVLVVDDDPLVRAVLVGLLSRAGYKVFAAKDGIDAIDWIKKPGNTADLVLLDMSMPRLSGLDTLDQIRSISPKMPVVLCSGSLTFKQMVNEKHNPSTLPDACISKPFEIPELTRTVREVLDQRKESEHGQKQR